MKCFIKRNLGTIPKGLLHVTIFIANSLIMVDGFTIYFPCVHTIYFQTLYFLCQGVIPVKIIPREYLSQ